MASRTSLVGGGGGGGGSADGATATSLYRVIAGSATASHRTVHIFYRWRYENRLLTLVYNNDTSGSSSSSNNNNILVRTTKWQTKIRKVSFFQG